MKSNLKSSIYMDNGRKAISILYRTHWQKLYIHACNLLNLFYVMVRLGMHLLHRARLHGRGFIIFRY